MDLLELSTQTQMHPSELRRAFLRQQTLLPPSLGAVTELLRQGPDAAADVVLHLLMVDLPTDASVQDLLVSPPRLLTAHRGDESEVFLSLLIERLQTRGDAEGTFAVQALRAFASVLHGEAIGDALFGEVVRGAPSKESATAVLVLHASALLEVAKYEESLSALDRALHRAGGVADRMRILLLQSIARIRGRLPLDVTEAAPQGLLTNPWEAVARLTNGIVTRDAPSMASALRTLMTESGVAVRELCRQVLESPLSFDRALFDEATKWAVEGKLFELAARLALRAGAERKAASHAELAIADSRGPSEVISSHLVLLDSLRGRGLRDRCRTALDRVYGLARGRYVLSQADELTMARAALEVADKDPTWIRRSREAAIRAATSPEKKVRVDALDVVVESARALAVACEPVSSETLGAALQELAPLVPEMPPAQVRKLEKVLELGLSAGNFVHPSVLDGVSRCLDMLPASKQRESLRVRDVAIRDGRDGASLPGWLARDVRPSAVSPAEVPTASVPRQLEAVLRVRPDLSEALCASAARVAARAGGEPADDVLGSIAAVVPSGTVGSEAYASLLGILESFPPERRGRSWRLAREAVARARREPIAYDESVPGGPPELLIDRAGRLIEAARLNQAQAPKAKAEAIRLLESVLRREPRDGWYDEALVILGNAYRLEPDPDFESAISLYRRASPRMPQARARLHKVWADALLLRGTDADLREAWTQIEKSLGLPREPEHRAAGLVTSAKIAFAHPDWDEGRRLAVSARRFFEAHEILVQDRDLYDGLLDVVAKWVRRSPGHPAQAEILRRIRDLHPVDQAELDVVARGYRTRLTGHHDHEEASAIKETMGNPAARAFFDAEHRYRPIDPIGRQMMEELLRREQVSPEKVAAVRASYDPTTLSADGLASLADELLAIQDAGRPGALTARAAIIGQLAEMRRATIADVRTATNDAVAHVRRLENASVKSLLLSRLASIWAPVDRMRAVVMDFEVAAALGREAIECYPNERSAPTDFLRSTARANMHRTVGDVSAHRAEAIRLLEIALARDRATGYAPTVANGLSLLATAISESGEGDADANLRRSIALEREAIELTTDPAKLGEYEANVAWSLTKLGERSTSDRQRILVEAREMFVRALNRPLSPAARANAESNFAVLRQVEQEQSDPDSAVRIWTERLAASAPRAPLERALIEHNLAEALASRDETHDLADAIAHYRNAIEVRAVSGDRRHAWESRFGLVRAMAILGQRNGAAVGDDSEIVELSRQALSDAMVIGRGSELARTATLAMQIAATASGFERIDSMAQDAWRSLQQAVPTLLASDSAAIEESRSCVGVAFALADAQLREGVTGGVGRVPLIGGTSADRILEWLVRADGPFRRAQLFHAGPPSDATEATKTRWMSVTTTHDADAIGSFLRDHTDLAARWLGPASVAPDAVRAILAEGMVGVGVWLAAQGFLCAVIDTESRHASILLIQAPMPRMTEADLATLARDLEKSDAFDACTRWVRATVVVPVLASLSARPRRVRWCPHGWLRLIPTASLFSGIPTEWTSTLASSPAAREPGARAGGLVVVADPGHGRGDLGSYAIEAATRLQAAMSNGRLVIGRHTRFGRELVATAADVRPTSTEVVRELADARVAIVVAHGHADSMSDVWIECLDKNGTPDPLDARALARRPNAVAGATVILLSCEMARTGDGHHSPGGVAGALLAGGARQVVAPLWPVSLRGAVELALRLVGNPALAFDAASALAMTSTVSSQDSVLLGRPKNSAAVVSARDQLAFVTWVG